MRAEKKGNEVIWIDAPGHSDKLEIPVEPVAFPTIAKVITLLFVVGAGACLWIVMAAMWWPKLANAIDYWLQRGFVR